MKILVSGPPIFLLVCLLITATNTSHVIAKSNKSSSEPGLNTSAVKTPATIVSISGEDFYINGSPTFQGRSWKGHRMEGLLPNSRMVNGIFDDLNPLSANLWKYPDTKKWDPDRNTYEFIKNMEDWKAHGLLCFNINLQGGSPQGYSQNQPWINSAFDATGALRPAYMKRLKRILDRADKLGMVVNLGFFYFGQDEHLQDEKAVISAVDNAIEWLFKTNYRNILIEVANECNNKAYNHAIIKADRIHELIDRIKDKQKNGFSYPVSTSYNGGDLPSALIVQKSDYILLHGNGVSDPARITKMVQSVKAMEGFSAKPIVFNEDDHYNFDKDFNNYTAATAMHASWGFFDYRRQGEPFEEGYQSVPVDWSIRSARKKGFFQLTREMTGVSSQNQK